MGAGVLLHIMIKSKNGLLERREITLVTDEIIEFARNKVESPDYKTFFNSKFDDDVWKLDRQSNKINIRFSYRNNEIKEICNKSNIDYKRFINELKCIAALRIGTCNINDLRGFVRYTLDEFVASEGFNILSEPQNKNHGHPLMHYLEFIKTLPYVDDEYLNLCKKTLNRIRIENNENKKERIHPCVLNEFQSYFILNDILDNFWKNCTNKELKYFYYPLYLFWKITTILPMRVTEFCVTPYNCLRKDGELFYLTIRRSHLKGSSSLVPKIHYYQIEKDYDEYEYEIPKWMYNLINEYKELTMEYKHLYNLLFSTEYMLEMNREPLWTANSNKVFSSLELADLLKDFYKKIVCYKYGYSIVSEKILKERYKNDDGSYEMSNDEIMLVQSKHTRHLAMINLIMRGCNPVMIREFAGHADELTSANYYGNVSKTVRCATKYLYDKAKNRRSSEKGFIQQDYEENPFALLINKENDYIVVDNGKCFSEKFIRGNYYDCGTVDGNCFSCKYFIPDTINDHQEQALMIDHEMDFLMKMLESNTINKRIEEFQVRSQLLESNIANYANQCWQELMEEDNGSETKV